MNPATAESVSTLNIKLSVLLRTFTVFMSKIEYSSYSVDAVLYETTGQSFHISLNNKI